MKSYTITVNGNVYDVTVEENGSVSAPAAAPRRAAAPAAPAAAPKAAAPAGAQGAVKISAPMPGKILGVKANAGDAVKKGQVIVVLEAMKMENEIMAPRDAVVASVQVNKGDSVDSGTPLVSLQ